MLSLLHPPGQIYLAQKYDWENPSEWRFAYGNIPSSSKILSAQRMAAPLTVVSWQLKRFNLRYSSFKSNCEGSFRLLCLDCHKYQTQAIKPSPFITQQGCGFCIGRLNYVDTTLCVSTIFKIKKVQIRIFPLKEKKGAIFLK